LREGIGGSGPNNYTKIQDAINDSVDGDIVFVYDDSSPYYENIEIDNSINLVGESKDTTIIDSGDNPCITINTNNSHILGFYIRCIDLGIYSKGNYNIISDNNIITKWGIEVGRENHNNKIYKNILECNNSGIILGQSSSHNYIYDNIVKHHKYGAVAVILNNYSEYNIIDNNTIMNQGGSDRGNGDIWIIEANNNIFSNNTLISSNDRFYGVRFFYSRISYNNIFENNTFTGYKTSGISAGSSIIRYNDFIDCDTGLILYDGGIIVNNNFINCNEGISLFRCKGANIKYNNFIDNNRNARFSLFSLFNTWDSNYWGEPRDSLYIIRGTLFLFIPWFNFDWNPAQEPYDI